MLKSTNEDIKMYLPGSSERKNLKTELAKLENQHFDIPIIINGKEYKTNDLGKCVKPHNHKHELATFHKAGEKEINMAIQVKMGRFKKIIIKQKKRIMEKNTMKEIKIH